MLGKQEFFYFEAVNSVLWECLGEAVRPWAEREGIPSRGVGRPELAPSPGNRCLLPARHLAPNPTYPHLYRRTSSAATPTRRHWRTARQSSATTSPRSRCTTAAATAMAQRADMLRACGESSLALNCATGPRGGWDEVHPGTRLERDPLPRIGLILVCPGS